MRDLYTKYYVRKLISFILIIALVAGIGSTNMFDSEVQASEWYTLTSVNNDANRYQSDMPNIGINLPDFATVKSTYGLGDAVESIFVNGKTLEFNVELYLDLGLQVYGSPSDILANHTDYNKNVKNFATDEADVEIDTYFREWYKIANTENTFVSDSWNMSDLRTIWNDPRSYAQYQVYGVEYRYVGYTKTGEYYPNPRFPEDSKDNWANNRWIQEYWKDFGGGVGRPSTYNQMLYNKTLTVDEETPIKTNITNYLGGQDGNNTTIDTGTKVTTSNVIVDNYRGEYEFVNAMAIPSPYTSERKKMYHFESNGDLYYQTLTLDKAGDRVIPFTSVDVTISNPSMIEDSLKASSLDGDASTITIPEVVVKMSFDDSKAFDTSDKPAWALLSEWIKAKKNVYYNRDDLKYWEVDFNFGGTSSRTTLYTSEKIYNSTSGVRVDGNTTYLTISNLTVPSSAIGSDGSLVAEAIGRPYFYDSYETDNIKGGYSDDGRDIVGNMGLFNDFEISDSISVSYEDLITPDGQIGYHDKSLGDIASYSFLVRSYDVDTFVGTNKTMSNASHNNPAVDVFVASEIDIVLGMLNDELQANAPEGETPKLEGDFNFNLQQTIVGTSGESITVNKDFMVTVGLGRQPFYVNPDVNIPDDIWDNQNLPVSNNTDESQMKSKNVWVDGRQLSSSEESKFWNGTFNFDNFGGVLKDDDTFHYIRINYTSTDDMNTAQEKWVLERSTKPVASALLSGTFKENRLVGVTNISATATNPLLQAYAPINSITWKKEIQEEDGSWREITSNTGDILQQSASMSTSDYLALQSNEEGTFRVTLTVSNGIQSDTNSFMWIALNDYEADVVFNAWNSTLTRNESLDAYLSMQSLDGDTLTSDRVVIFEDLNGNDTYEQAEDRTVYDKSKDEFIADVEADAMTFTDLGEYQFYISATEDFGEPYIAEFVDDTEKVFTEVYAELFVANLQPLNDLYTDAKTPYPKVDIEIMVDSTISNEDVSAITNNRVNLINDLLNEGLDANIHVTDLETYVYTEFVQTSRNTGSSYPSSTYYYTAGAKAGTLNRYNVVNNQYVTQSRRSRTATDSKSASTTRSNTYTYYYSQDEDGNWSLDSYSGSQLPSTISYSSGGYSGTLSKGSGSGGGFSGSYPVKTRTWTTTYSGTVYRTYTEYYYVDVWNDNYTGYYQGTVYEYVKQDVTHEFRSDSDKYIIYISEDGMSQKADFDMINGLADATIITIGDDALMSGITKDAHFTHSDTMSNLSEALKIPVADHPYDYNTILLEKGESVGTINTDDFDYEGDPIAIEEYQFVHNSTYYDNSEGLESIAVASYDKSNYSQAIDLSSFTSSKVGQYTVYRRTKDAPVSDPTMGLYSNEAKIEILVHRRPISQFALDWSYNETTRLYDTTWLDQSYDLDHNVSDPVTKGIVDRKITWWDTADPTNKFYTIPDNLVPNATYTVEYIVQDEELAWSDVYSMTFTLDSIPPIQFIAQARTNDNRFAMTSIPASEDLLAYDMWTRHPYDVNLEIGIYSTGLALQTTAQVVNFSEGITGTKTDQDIDWTDVVYNIPETLPDGDYIFRVSAEEVVGSQVEHRDFNVTVDTPVDLNSSFNNIMTEDNNRILATTSIYVNHVDVDLFVGTANQINNLVMTEISNDGFTKTWEYIHYQDTSIPDGFYDARFTANTPNGNSEDLIRNFKLVSLKILGVDIWGDWDFWNGQVDIFGTLQPDMPHRFLGLENVHVDAILQGTPDTVSVRFSPELEAMVWTNSYGHTYTYNEFDLTPVSFPLVMSSADGTNYTVEYVLPLSDNTLTRDHIRVNPQRWVEVTAVKGTTVVTYRIEDIDITGNTTQQFYIQHE